VGRTEDVLEVYHRPLDLARPVVCPDEVPVQLVGEVRAPLPATPGRPARYDYEYKRNGTADLFIAFTPLLGRRAIRVTERRTAADFAGFLRWVVEGVYAGAGRVVLVTDNLNVRAAGSLYEAFDPTIARRVAERVEWHDTPKHGSWPNVAEAEWAVRARQCLNRRVGSTDELRRRVEAWGDDRNHREVEARWRFATADARIRLRRLYPSVQ
jgi:hypothetical protein